MRTRHGSRANHPMRCLGWRISSSLGASGGASARIRDESAPISSSLGTSNTQRWWDSRTDEREDQPFDHERHLSAHKKCSHGRIWRQIERHRSVPGGASSYLWVFEAPKDSEICRVLGVAALETPKETPKNGEIVRYAQATRLIRFRLHALSHAARAFLHVLLWHSDTLRASMRSRFAARSSLSGQ